jgi:predicted PurR-regulated permease PerM
METTLRGNRPLAVIATIAVLMLLYWGEAFFVPLLIAVLLSYALAPVVGALTIVVRLRVIAALLVMLSIVALGAVAVWAWSDDVELAWQKLPAAAKTLSKSLQKVAQRPGSPVQQVQKAAQEVESIARAAGAPAPPPAAAPPPAQSSAMPMWQVLWKGWKSVMAGATQVMVVLFLMFFMLASGDLFKRKLISIAGDRLSKQKDALRVIEEIDQQIRRYLGVLLVSNVLVGLATWAAFWMLGVEYAGLWGLAAGVLHTAPYFGPAIIAFTSLLAAFLQFGEWAQAFMVSGTSVLVASLVGMVLQTWLASRTTRMNATAVFVGLLFFGWLWDLWGVLLAIPILAIVKTICERNDHWKPVAELLGE